MTLATILRIEREDEDGDKALFAVVDMGGDSNLTAELMQPAGDDSIPLPGDTAILVEIVGSGSMGAVAFTDAKNESKAQDGERRTFARDADGNMVAEIWAKRDGTIKISSLASGSKINLNGVEIDQDGNITVPGGVTAKGEVTAQSQTAPVKLSMHTHLTAMGPTDAPTPGT